MSEVEMKALEEDAQKCKVQIARCEAIKRLMQSEDFKNVILNDYCKEEKTRQLGLSVEPRLNVEKRELSFRLAQATSALENWLYWEQEKLDTALSQLKEIEDSIDQLRTGISIDNQGETNE